jgi:general stress protein 26
MFSKPEITFLNTMRVGRIATVNPLSGYPHMVPICFVFDGISFYTTLSEGSKRIRNIKSGSKVSLLFDKYEERDEEWLTLQGLLITCRISAKLHRKQRFFYERMALANQKILTI